MREYGAADEKPARCEHCANLTGAPAWRRNGFLTETKWPNGRRAWACRYCNEVAKVIEEGKPPDAELERMFNGFLAPIFRKTTGNIELRAFPSCSRIFSKRKPKLLEFITEHLHEELFFGVGTREGICGTKEGVAEIPALWADVDFKNFEGGEMEAAELIDRFPFKPTFTVRSGHGAHLYLLLDKPEPPSRRIESILKGIAKALRADPACAEIARVMRLPESFNRKNGEKILVFFE